MIIGQYCDSYPPTLDGVGMVVKNYVEELKKIGDTCYYVSANSPSYKKAEDFETLLYRGFKVRRDEPYRVGLPALDIPFQRRTKQIAFDIVHGHSPFSMGAEARRIARRRDIPLVGTFHTKFYDDFYDKTRSRTLASIATRYVLRFYNHCDEVWTVNSGTEAVLREYGYKGSISIIPNGTNLWYPTQADKQSISEAYGLGNDPMFLFVGQQSWKKNIRHIIDGVRLFHNTHPCKLLLVGQGGAASEIKAYVHEQGLDDTVLLLGHIPDRELLMRLYARADLFLFPSLYDTSGLVVREAAAAGTPSILVRDSCAAEGIIDGANGYLCENSPESLFEAMVRGLGSRGAVGEAARKTLPIQWSNVVATARARYEALLK